MKGTPIQLSDSFQVGSHVGHGGAGYVHAAIQESLRRTVAIKRILPEKDGEWARRRFRAEAMLTGYLDHPNIVPVHALGEGPSGEPYYAMKLLHGRSWLAELKDTQGPSKRNRGKARAKDDRSYQLADDADVSTAAQEPGPSFDFEWHRRILLKVCDAVAYAHSKGIIHRDLKPENVVLGEFDEAAVIDWGLAARLPKAAAHLVDVPSTTELRGLAGTPAYLAPEMIVAPNRVDERTDVWLLGAILYELLTGQPPNQGDFRRERDRFLDDVVHGRRLRLAAISHPRRLPASILEAAQPIVERALAIAPSKRFTSVAEFQAALRELPDHARALELVEGDADALRQMLAAPGATDTESLSEGEGASLSPGRGGRLRSAIGKSLEWIVRRVLGYEPYAPPTQELITAYDRVGRREAKLRLALSLWPKRQGIVDRLAEVRRRWFDVAIQADDVRLAETLFGVLSASEKTGGGDWAKIEQVRKDRQRRTHAHTALRLRAGAAIAGVLAVVAIMIVIPLLKAEKSRSRQQTTSAFRKALSPSMLRFHDCFSTDGSPTDWIESLTSGMEHSKELPDLAALTGVASAERGRRFRDVLAQRLRTGPDPVRVAAASNLAKIFGPDEFRSQLTGWIDGADLSDTLVGLSVLRQPPAASDAQASYERVAARLGPNAIPALWKHLASSESEQLGQAAADVIALLGDEGPKRLLDVLQEERLGAKAKRALETIPAERLFHLCEGRNDEGSGDLRHAAQKGLAFRARRKGVLKVSPVRELDCKEPQSPTCVAFSPDGRYVLSGHSWKGSVILWDVATGLRIRTFEGHKGEINAVGFSPDGAEVLAGGFDKKLHVWNATTGQQTLVLEGHEAPVWAAAFSPDGRYIVSGSENSSGSRNVPTLRLWDAKTGQCLHTFGGFYHSVFQASFSLDGRYILTGRPSDAGASTMVWDVATGKPLKNRRLGTPGFADADKPKPGEKTGSSAEGILFSPHGFPLTVTPENFLMPRDAAGRPILGLTGVGVRSPYSFSPDGRMRIVEEKLAEIDWDLELPEQVDWDEGARPYLDAFLTLHTPYAAKLDEQRTPSEPDVVASLTRRGKATWTESDFNELILTLQRVGYGWLRPEGVRRELEKTAAQWAGPPPCWDQEIETYRQAILAANTSGGLSDTPKTSASADSRPVVTKTEASGQVASLRAALAHASDSKDQIKLMSLIGGLGEDAKETVPDLGKLVNQPNGDVREAAVAALIQIGTEARAALPELISSLRYELSLQSKSSRSSSLLVPPALNFNPRSERNSARSTRIAELFAVIGPPAASALIQAVSDKQNPREIRERAVEVLGALGRKTLGSRAGEVVTALRATAKEAQEAKERRLLEAALSALRQLGPDPQDPVSYHVELLSMPSSAQEAREALTKIGAPAVPALVEVIRAEDQPIGLRTEATIALRFMKAATLLPYAKQVVPALGKAANQDNDDLRKWALKALRELGPDAQEAADDVIAALRYTTATSVGDVVDVRWSAAEKEKHQRDRERYWQYSDAVSTLSGIGQPAVSVLVKALADKNAAIAVYAGAACALARMDPKVNTAPALPVLRVRAKHDDPIVRKAAQEALDKVQANAQEQARKQKEEKERRAQEEKMKRLEENIKRLEKQQQKGKGKP